MKETDIKEYCRLSPMKNSIKNSFNLILGCAPGESKSWRGGKRVGGKGGVAKGKNYFAFSQTI